MNEKAEKSDLKKVAIKSLLWKFFEKTGVQVVQLVISVVLARLLMPEDYGVFAMIMVFIAIAQVFIHNGLPYALIRKVNSDELDANSVFYCNLAIAVVLYMILFFTSPYISSFYGMPELTLMLRILSLTLIVGCYSSMQNVMLAKNFLFKRMFISSFSSVIITGIIGIVMAIYGFGVWAIIFQNLSSVVVLSIVMSFTIRWRPKLQFSFKRLKILYSFGWKMLAAAFVDTLYNNGYSLLIGKKYSEEQLAYWNRGQTFPSFLGEGINSAITSVMFPLYSRCQDNKAELKAILRRSTKLSAYLVFPMMMGLAVCAEPFVRILLGEKWLPCVPFLQGWCLCYAFMPLQATALQVYNALGRGSIFLGLETVKKLIGIGVLCATLPFGLPYMMLGRMLVSVLFLIINFFPNKKILGYSYKEQISDLLPTFLITCLMGAIIYPIIFIPIHYFLQLILQVFVGVAVYFAASLLFRQESFFYCFALVKKVFLSVRKKGKKEDNGEEAKADESESDGP